MISDDQLCLHCGACVGACSTNSIFLHETARIEFLPTCTGCGLCVIVCPVGSIGPVTKESSASTQELAREALA